MPFLRFTRDRRGYEHFQLVQPGTNRRGTAKPRILYWFRSPPNIRVGRTPFDDAARIALEKQNPDVAFDWTQILATPIPSVDAERWRERRRQDRTARQSAIEEDTAEEPDIGEPDVRDADLGRADAGISMAAENVELPAPAAAESPRPVQSAGASRRARRRRRGRRRPDAVTEAVPERDDSAASPDPEINADDPDAGERDG